MSERGWRPAVGMTSTEETLRHIDRQAKALKKLGWTFHVRPCRSPQIHPEVPDGSIREMVCGCGHREFNADDNHMQRVYEWHRARADAAEA